MNTNNNDNEPMKLSKSDIQFGEWQLCPKCNGQGKVSKPPYAAGDIPYWESATNASWVCDVCNGAKILARPIIK